MALGGQPFCAGCQAGAARVHETQFITQRCGLSLELRPDSKVFLLVMFYSCGYRMENMGGLGGEWQQPGSRGDGSGGGSDGGAEDGGGGGGRAGGVESSGGGGGGVMEMAGDVEVEVVLAVPRHRALGLLSHLMWTQKVGLLPRASHTATPQATCLLPWAYLLLGCSLRINRLAHKCSPSPDHVPLPANNCWDGGTRLSS